MDLGLCFTACCCCGVAWVGCLGCVQRLYSFLVLIVQLLVGDLYMGQDLAWIFLIFLASARSYLVTLSCRNREFGDGTVTCSGDSAHRAGISFLT